MKILVLNCGSSSIKYKLFDMTDKSVIAAGGIEKIGLEGAFLKTKDHQGETVKIFRDIPEHTIGIQLILDTLTDDKLGCIKSLKEIDAVGHRLVHGGEKFNKSVLITEEVKQMVVECSDLAPLHNPANLKGVSAIDQALPGIPQVGVFDTAFHQTMPDYAYLYALPYEIYKKYGIRRYGFHGTSHRYVSQRVCEFLGVDPTKQRIVVCHIGNGGSLSAVKYGKCIDTTMGLTPLEGIMMGTRAGDLDGGAITYLQKKLNMDADQMSNFLNKKCGVLGVFERSSDMRELEQACFDKDERALLTLNMYNYRIKKYIGAYAAAMNGLDIIVFTAGVGENQPNMREGVLQGLDYLGVKFDNELNKTIFGKNSREVVLSTPDSKVKVCVIPTDEELMIASDTMDIVSKL